MEILYYQTSLVEKRMGNRIASYRVNWLNYSRNPVKWKEGAHTKRRREANRKETAQKDEGKCVGKNPGGVKGEQTDEGNTP